MTVPQLVETIDVLVMSFKESLPLHLILTSKGYLVLKFTWARLFKTNDVVS